MSHAGPNAAASARPSTGDPGVADRRAEVLARRRRRLRRADEAARDRAAAPDDGAGDVLRRARHPATGAGRRDRRRWSAVGRAPPRPTTASTTATSTSRCGVRVAGRCPVTSSRRSRPSSSRRCWPCCRPWSSALWVNWLSAALSVLANAFYVFVYTMLLKRRTTQNIVWGGLAGCFPALIGWTAVTGELAWTPVVLFLVVFFWTPPHTWALALRYREDYAQRRRADAPRGQARDRGRTTGRHLQLGDGRHVAAAVAGRRDEPGLPGRRRRPGRRASSSRRTGCGSARRAPRP